MKKYAVVVAGGIGSRMNSSIPKQFLILKNKPLLFYTINAFLQAYDDLEVILVLPTDHLAKGQEIIDAYFENSRIQICEGGRTRFHSVRNGLSLISEDSIVFVHDGVRCLITKELIHRCYAAASNAGTAIPAIPVKDSVRITTEKGNEPIDRDKLWLIQTPQTFHSKILLTAYNIDYKDKFTDDASVVEAFGLRINLVDGDVNNIKVTTPHDLHFAESKIM